MILRKGPNGSSHSLSIGTLRIDEQIRESAQQPRQFIEMYLESNIRTACDILAEDLQLDSLRIFVLYWCGRALCRKLPFRKSPGQLRGTWTANSSSNLQTMLPTCPPRNAWHNITFHGMKSKTNTAGLTIERMFLERTGADTIIVPNISIREGILLAQVQGMNKKSKRNYADR